MRRIPKRLLQLFLPRSLAGRFALLLIAALAVAQAMAVAIFLSESSRVRRVVARTQEVDRMATLVRAIDAAPQPSRSHIIQAFGSRLRHYWTSDTPLVATAAVGEQEQQIAVRLRRMTRNSAQDPRIALVEHNGDPGGDDWPADVAALPYSLNISVRLADGTWLNGETRLRVQMLPWANMWLFMLAGTVAAVIAVVVFGVRWIVRPLTALAEAAGRVGRGESVEPLAVTGPSEVARTVNAFNVMQQRLSRFVSDRLAMVAAISHDLRTPITAARIRAEMIDDGEVRDAIVRSLVQMQYITETTLSFARDETASEEPRTIDLVSLVEAVADDLTATGQDVAVAGHDQVHYRCRPVLLRRALTNLMSNAAKYGKRAQVALCVTREHARITVDDEGPGLPPDQLEKVFEPFVRLDPSRNSETEGLGLGLSIARTVIRAHGGEVTLMNVAGGLRAEVTLPREWRDGEAGADAPALRNRSANG
jgi:signal transduction histidine kinase